MFHFHDHDLAQRQVRERLDAAEHQRLVRRLKREAKRSSDPISTSTLRALRRPRLLVRSLRALASQP